MRGGGGRELSGGGRHGWVKEAVGHIVFGACPAARGSGSRAAVPCWESARGGEGGRRECGACPSAVDGTLGALLGC